MVVVVRVAVRSCAPGTTRSDSVAVAYDGDVDARVSLAGHADVSTPDDRLRHPARVLTMRRRGDALPHRRRCDSPVDARDEAPIGLPGAIQTPSGGTTPIVAFDWLDASAARYDYLYDFAIVGVDGARRAHVWTIRDADDSGARAPCARRPIVTHRGAMTLETRWTGRAWTCDDNIAVRAALTRRRDDTRVVVASRAFGRRPGRRNRPTLRRYIARVCEDTRRPSSIAGRIRRAMFSSPSTRRGRDARGVDAKRRGRWMTSDETAAASGEARGAGGVARHRS